MLNRLINSNRTKTGSVLCFGLVPVPFYTPLVPTISIRKYTSKETTIFSSDLEIALPCDSRWPGYGWKQLFLLELLLECFASWEMLNFTFTKPLMAVRSTLVTMCGTSLWSGGIKDFWRRHLFLTINLSSFGNFACKLSGKETSDHWMSGQS